MSSPSVAEKLVVPPMPAPLSVPGGRSGGSYDSALGLLRPERNFWLTVVILNLISAAGVFWYYKLGGPLALRFAFDYNYFLYFLVFHVTFSFSPKPRAINRHFTQGAV